MAGKSTRRIRTQRLVRRLRYNGLLKQKIAEQEAARKQRLEEKLRGGEAR